MPKDTPKEKRKRGPLRRVFRYCRIIVLVIVLLLVLVVTYLNQVGLPDFVKASLLEELSKRGLDARFSRLSWRWHEGVVAENFFVERRGADGLGPQFSADRAALRFDMDAMGRLSWRFDAVELSNGDLNWRLSDTNLADQLRLSSIDTLLRFQGEDTLELVRLTSNFKGLNLSVSGTLNQPRALNQRGVSTNRSAANVQVLNETMNRVANYLTNFEFTATPELDLRFTADASNWSELSADLRVRLPETTTSWGTADQMDLLARVRPSPTGEEDASIELLLTGNRANTPWGQLWNWEVETRTVPLLEIPINSSNEVTAAFSSLETEYGTVENGSLNFVVQPVSTERPDEMDMNLELGGQRFVTEWGTAGELAFAYHGTISRTNWIPINGTNVIDLQDLESDHGRADHLHLEIAQQPQRADWQPQADESWGDWRWLEPYILDFDIRGQGIDAHEVEVESARISGSWAAPQLRLDQVVGRLYDGDFALSGDIDVPSGRIGFEAETDLDYHALDHKFSEKFGRWFQPYQWESTPHVEVSGKLVWPDWNVYKPNWKQEVGPSLGISGTFSADHPSYKGIPGLKASSTFHLTNFIWHLPDLTIVRPEGVTTAVYDGNDLTKDYRWQLDATINPHALEVLFQDRQKRVFQFFTNHVTPHVTGKIWGRWRAHDLIGFDATVSAPSIEIRGEAVDQVDARILYTNRFMVIADGVIQQSNQVARADGMGIDFPGRKMFFTNVTGNVPPMSIARAIGTNTARAVEPYIFETPPDISMNGTLGLKGHAPTDLVFKIDGRDFRWWHFEFDQIAGRLDWRHNTLLMTNVSSSFYGGDALGNGFFTFYTNRPTEFSFQTALTNSLLQPLVRDVFQNNNNLEGQLSGELSVTYGRSDSRDTWDGYGNMNLKDGLLWDIPIFAIFSPLFNAISPGLGSSQADEATANFVLINGTVISTDLEIKSTEMNMKYRGSIDHLGNVNALMEARILKEAGPIGPLISTALRPLTKLFEYKLTGTLSEPEAEPIFIPKFLMLALEPFKALGNLLKPSDSQDDSE